MKQWTCDLIHIIKNMWKWRKRVSQSCSVHSYNSHEIMHDKWSSCIQLIHSKNSNDMNGHKQWLTLILFNHMHPTCSYPLTTTEIYYELQWLACYTYMHYNTSFWSIACVHQEAPWLLNIRGILSSSNWHTFSINTLFSHAWASKLQLPDNVVIQCLESENFQLKNYLQHLQ